MWTLHGAVLILPMDAVTVITAITTHEQRFASVQAEGHKNRRYGLLTLQSFIMIDHGHEERQRLLLQDD